MMELEEKLCEDAILISKALREIQTRVSEADKLQKQTGVPEAIFQCHVVLKKELIVSYLQLHQGTCNEINIDRLAEFINPDAYKNGLFMISSK